MCNQWNFITQQVKVILWVQKRCTLAGVVERHAVGQSTEFKEKSGTMKLLPENIKVLYFASGEPYVEVGLLYLITLGVQLYCM